MAAFPNLSSDAGLKKLDEHLLTRSYLTECQASKDDLTIFVALAKPPSSQYLNASRWYNHIVALLRTSGLSAEGSGVTIEGPAPIREEAVATHPEANSKDAADKEEEDDDVDLFGEETEEEKKAGEERSPSVKASTKKKEYGRVILGSIKACPGWLWYQEVADHVYHR